jgi:uncharacterized protein YPO0396
MAGDAPALHREVAGLSDGSSETLAPYLSIRENLCGSVAKFALEIALL